MQKTKTKKMAQGGSSRAGEAGARRWLGTRDRGTGPCAEGEEPGGIDAAANGGMLRGKGGQPLVVLGSVRIELLGI